MAKYLLFLFPVAGIVLFVAGLRYRRRLKFRVEGFVRAVGMVVDNVAGAEGFAVVVEYFVGGKSFSVTSEFECNPRRKEGSQLAVMYNPANPSEAVLAEDYYVVANALLAVGSLFVLVGILIVYDFVAMPD